ncbi:hypothetical protein OMK64_15240 [Cellulomonas fimi]|uniref:hypothetical protein n=1 Tax=Cellulomonas fimi TaxID=1708 RepID=UPI00234C52DD|nr:hypothetical protein [Cellulomonas fimi]MDC7122888.1 hypothetical protein [Cellulomonas fimi]
MGRAPRRPTPSAPEPAVRQSAIDDATVLRRLAEPRTGETWHEPEPADEVRLVESDFYGTPTSPRTVRVGARGDAVIYAVVGPHHGLEPRRDVRGLFEVDAAGARYIACPSPRVEECDAEAPYTSDLAPGVVVDVDTFYDTLGIPVEAELVDGFTVRTSGGTGWERLDFETGSSRPVPALGNGSLLVTDTDHWRADDAVDVARFGPAALVELRWAEAEIDGLTNASYAWRTPYGAYVSLTADDVPGGDYDAIVWDDGVDRRYYADEPDLVARTGAPGDGTCAASMFSLDAAHVDAEWRPAGRTPEGVRVHVPVGGGNPLATRVRAFQEKIAWTVDPDDPSLTLTGASVYAETGMTTDEAFLAAHSLFAIERPDGVWMVGLSPAAAAPVFECA